MLQESLLHWIRNDNSMTIRLSTGDCNVTIDNALATPENYQVRWYVLKDQKDGWHVDGVMTATTKEMTVTKAFRNLSETEVNKILADGYGIDMKVGKGVYLSLKPENTESTKGQYVYTGSYDAATKTYTCVWTVRVLNGEHYVIQEKGYAYDTNNYNITEEITDASGNTLYKPNITTADRFVWSNTVTGTMRESAVQLSENWVNIKNYEEMQVPAQKNLTVQKQWSDLTAAAHPAVTVHLYQMQTDAATGEVLETVEYGTATLDESGNWTHTWENVPQCSGDKTQNYSYFVREEAVSGYDTRYFTTGEETTELLPAKCTVDGAELLAAPVDWEKASVTIVNRECPRLPYTGGTGVTRYHVLGLLLTLGAGTGIAFRYRKRKHS